MTDEPEKRKRGRPAGSPNKATACIRDAAREYTAKALLTLAEVMAGDNPTARVAAANSLLDRAYGRPKQTVDTSGPGGGPIETVNIDPAKLSADQLRALASIAVLRG